MNVRNSTDDFLMGALGNDAFRNGLSLLTTMQLALKPFVGLAGIVVKTVAARKKDYQVY